MAATLIISVGCRLVKRAVEWLLFLCFALSPAFAAPPRKPPAYFLQIRDRQLFLGPTLFRNIGVVTPDLFERFLHHQDLQGDEALADARLSGVHFVRCAAVVGDPAEFGQFTSAPDRWFAAFDRMLTSAWSHEIYLAPSLIYDGRALTGAAQQQRADLLTPGTASNALAVRYVAAVVTRYRNDPRVLFWEIGDNLNHDADLSPDVTTDKVSAFLQQMARLIHHLDRRHAVMSGCGDVRNDAWHRWQETKSGRTASSDALPPDNFDQYVALLRALHPPGIDLISTQQSPPLADRRAWLLEDAADALRLPWIQYAATLLDRPLVASAFGQPILAGGLEQEAPWTLDFLRRLQADASPLAALRTWEPLAAGPDAVSPLQTPRLATALKAANTVISDAIASGLTLAQGPPLPYGEQAVQADRLQVRVTALQTLAADLMTRRRVPPKGKVGDRVNQTGVTLHLPDAEATVFRLRDAAWLLGADFIPPDEVAGWVRLLVAQQVGAQGLKLPDGRILPPGSVPDHFALDGAAAWFPEGDARPLPPADNPFYLIALVNEHWRLTGRPTLFASKLNTPAGRVALADACDRAFDAVASDAETGLVLCGTKAGDDRADWGFADRVHKSGFCLMPSLLRYRAARSLAALFRVIGAAPRAERYQVEGDRIRAALASTFYLPLGQIEGKNTGMLLSATGQGRKEDLWGAAYAVWLGVLPGDLRLAVARRLLVHWQSGGVVAQGMIRPLPTAGPYGGNWEQCADPPDTGQNGGCWGLPVGWYVSALMRVDGAAANALLTQYLEQLQRDREKGAPWEWIAPAHNLMHGPGNLAAVAQPVAALRTGATTTP